MTTEHQILETGRTAHQEYSELGFAGVPMVQHPGSCFGLIVGRPGAGKSCLLQSNPDAYIINTDHSSTTCPEPKAVMWPGFTEHGIPIDVDGNAMELTWQSMLDKQAAFLTRLDAGKPAPRTVAIDSLGGTIGLVMDYVTLKAGRKDFKELDGRRAWDDVYAHIIKFAADFRKRGIGFIFTCHVVDAKIPLGDDRWEMKPELTITANFYKRLYWQFEMVVALVEQWDTETRMVPRKNADGTPHPTRTKPVAVKVKRHILTTGDESLTGITKCRVKLEDLELPRTDAWAVFEKAYLAAV